jgi:sugar lactone lactonase YvrE/mono/diheme cytochrome c family protein
MTRSASSRNSLCHVGSLAGILAATAGLASCTGLPEGEPETTGQSITTALFSETFNTGIGQFTSAGSVSVTTGAARMAASSGTGNDGAITSQPFSTVGFSSITLSFDRVTVGLDRNANESGIAEVSINGGAFAIVEATRATNRNRVSFPLGAAAANQARVVLRFRVDANATNETYEVDNITVDGTSDGGGNQGTPPAVGDFVTFETGHVRPLALSGDGLRLYAVNTPDNRIEVFDTSAATPRPIESIPVGLEPVAVALANDGQLWVVNHLSDSISIVDVSVTPARITNTLLVGDEPSDIVFAGPGNAWAFITAAHRGQNAPFDPRLATPGTGRADVWVFDSTNLGTALGGTPLTILNMFGDTLRGLARNADGTRVFAAVLYSGNRTTVLTDDIGAGGITKAPPFTAADGATQPATGLVVKFNGSRWLDSGDPRTNTAPRDFTARVKLTLPDLDVFTINATGTTPQLGTSVSGVGTTLLNLAVNPRSGVVYASNLESLNLTRFEGPGTRSTTVRGHFVESRITVIDGTTVAPRHLNKHVTSYSANLGTPSERALSLATPLQMAITADGNRMFVVAMGSSKLARYSVAQLEANTFTPAAADQLVLSGGGPTGVVLDEARGRAFVSTRFDNGISVVDTQQLSETAHVAMFNPEPQVVIAGRPFLYDANLSSSRGDSSCAGCHIFGDLDHLSWDLGNPDGVVVQNPGTYNVNTPTFVRNRNLHPMKGPMATQSLRGLARNGPMHWRGDRTGATRDGNETLEEQSFEDFNGAFTDLLGRDAQLTTAQMDAFAKFALRLTYPPNPIANLDNSLTAAQAQGAQIYNTVTSDGITQCNGCHVLNLAQGRFGTDGNMSFEGGVVSEDMKIPHLRNMYQKVGMFAFNTQQQSSPAVGAQIRGFGFDNIGASGSLNVFLQSPVFSLSATQRAQVEQFLLAFPSDLNPVVGQQVTVTAANAGRADVQARLDLLVQRASVTTPRPECELVAKAVLGGQQVGWVMSGQSFVPSSTGDAAVSLPQLLDQAATAGAALTFTCVPPGNGTRIGIDRDTDGVRDRNDG